MSGTKHGGKKAAITNKLKHGNDFYKNIGRKGGKKGHTGGFAANPELARIAGRKGGLKSRRTAKKRKEILDKYEEYRKNRYKIYDPELESDKEYLKHITS